MTIREEIDKQEEICKGRFVSRKQAALNLKWIIGIIITIALGIGLPILAWTNVKTEDMANLKVRMNRTEKDINKIEKNMEAIERIEYNVNYIKERVDNK